MLLQISLAKIKYLILDEADRMLDMGFEPEVRKIVEKMGMPAKGDRQTLMFSATFPDQIQRLALDFLNNYLFVTVGRVGSANTDIQQTIFEVTQYAKRDKLVELLNESGKSALRQNTVIIIRRPQLYDVSIECEGLHCDSSSKSDWLVSCLVIYKF